MKVHQVLQPLEYCPTGGRIYEILVRFALMTVQKNHQLIADRLGISIRQIANTITLLDEGATVPFISRYRKEMTGEPR